MEMKIIEEKLSKYNWHIHSIKGCSDSKYPDVKLTNNKNGYIEIKDGCTFHAYYSDSTFDNMIGKHNNIFPLDLTVEFVIFLGELLKELYRA